MLTVWYLGASTVIILAFVFMTATILLHLITALFPAVTWIGNCGLLRYRPIHLFPPILALGWYPMSNRWWFVDASLEMTLCDFAWIEVTNPRPSLEMHYGILSWQGKAYDVYTGREYASLICDISTDMLKHAGIHTVYRDDYGIDAITRDTIAVLTGAMMVVPSPTNTFTPPLF